MIFRYLTIRPRDPLVFRDGRPFGFGQRMKTLSWPNPSVLAGSFRTFLGKKLGYSFTPKEVEQLRQVRVAGPFAWMNDTIWFSAPKDCIIRKEGKITDVFRVIPMQSDDLSGCGCNLPDGLLSPTTLFPAPDDEFKPGKVLPLWSQEIMVRWLLSSSEDLLQYFSNNPDANTPNMMDFPPRDYRVHVKIDSISGASSDGMLYETAGLDFTRQTVPQGLQFVVRIGVPAGEFGEAKLCGMHPFGGKRRLSEWNTSKNKECWACPQEISSALSKTRFTRLVLATPGIFTSGWLPGWLVHEDGYLVGTPPGAEDRVKLKLISACIGRYEPLSGWNMERVGDKEKGAKPLRRMVPAGSVYYFESIGEDGADALCNVWLQSVCDSETDRNDGFGLALWGVWDYWNQTKDDVV